MRYLRSFSVLILFAAGVLPGKASPVPNVEGIGIEQKLDSVVPLNTPFRDEAGNPVTLGQYFHDKPVLLAPVYFSCPMLCSQILSGVVSSLRPLSLRPGRDFEVVAVSFDPQDSPAVASQKRLQYSHSLSSRDGTAGWHFLTGRQSSITAVMNAVGFHYRWDATHNMFIHASGIMLLTPEGRVAKYLYGVDYEPKDLKLGLVESSHNRIGSAVDQILLLCYHYDPKTGKYNATVVNILRGAGIATLLLMGLVLGLLWRRDLREYRPITTKASHP